MTERVISIETFENLKLLPSTSWADFDGYKIACTDGHNYFLGIENSRSCCERFGYMTFKNLGVEDAHLEVDCGPGRQR